jgi:hypothetical protein
MIDICMALSRLATAGAKGKMTGCLGRNCVGCSGMPRHVGRQPLYIQDEALNLERKTSLRQKIERGSSSGAIREERRG